MSRQADGEFGADAGFAAAGHLSAMTRDGRLNEGESKSDAAARQGLTRTLEPLEGPKGGGGLLA